MMLARGIVVRGNSFGQSGILLIGVTEVLIEANTFTGVGAGVCLSRQDYFGAGAAAVYDLVYRENTGPVGAAVVLCANCEIAMRTNGYGALDTKDGRAQCVNQSAS